MSRGRFAMDNIDTISVSGGTATLAPRVAAEVPSGPCPGAPPAAPGWVSQGEVCVETSHIMTKTSIPEPASGKSLWMAARIKNQSGANLGDGGTHSAFWFNSGYCAGGEVDIVEYMGDNRKADASLPNGVAYRGSLGHKFYDQATCPGGNVELLSLLTTNQSESQNGDGTTGAPWSSRYHIFAVRWIPGGAGVADVFQVFIDGTRVGNLEGRDIPGNEIPGLILSNLIGDYENRGAKSLAGSAYEVDWVQAWEL